MTPMPIAVLAYISSFLLSRHDLGPEILGIRPGLDPEAGS